MNLNEKKILIVGAAKGIGKAVATRLAHDGAKLFVCDKDQQALESSDYLRSGDCTSFSLDLTDRGVVVDKLAWLHRETAGLDAVIITAGVHGSYPVEYLSDETVDKILDINLSAQIKFVRDVIPLINHGGRIITVSSVSAGIGIPMQSIYSASKAGLELFFESLATELEYKNINCSIIQPGNVNTGFNETGNDYQPMGNSYIDALYEKVVGSIDSKFGMPPEQVAEAILKALTSKTPKLCYVVGGNAIKAHWAKRILGRDLSLKVLKKVMGLEAS